MLSVQNCFMRPKEKLKEADECRMKFTHKTGDHLTILAAFKAYKLKKSSDNVSGILINLTRGIIK